MQAKRVHRPMFANRPLGVPADNRRYLDLWPRSEISRASPTRTSSSPTWGSIQGAPVRQLGIGAWPHQKAGRAHVRGVLVEAAWSASRAPGPLRAFYRRIKARRRFQTAIVATARKMTVLAWHLVTKDQDYMFARPALVTHKRRKLELAAGAPSRRGNHRQPGAAYHSKQRRNEKNAGLPIETGAA